MKNTQNKSNSRKERNMEKDNKTSRANETRSKTERPKVWVPPSSLDAPPAPDGFRYRWIRAESVGFQDTKNISGRLREGYELVRSEEIAQQRQAYMTDRHKQRDEAIKNDLMKEQDQRMPINVDRQSRVTFGGTKK